MENLIKKQALEESVTNYARLFGPVLIPMTLALGAFTTYVLFAGIASIGVQPECIALEPDMVGRSIQYMSNLIPKSVILNLPHDMFDPKHIEALYNDLGVTGKVFIQDGLWYAQSKPEMGTDFLTAVNTQCQALHEESREGIKQGVGLILTLMLGTGVTTLLAANQ